MNKYLKAIFANFIFMAINTLSFLVLTPLAINIMGEEFYGLWSVIYSIMLFSNIGTLGISAIVNKFAAEEDSEGRDKKDREIITSAIVIILPMGILTSGILWLASGLIAEKMNVVMINQNDLISSIRICSIGILLQFMSKIPQGYLLSKYKNNIVRSIDFLTNIFPWIGAIIISNFQKNLNWIAIWFVVLQLMTNLIYGIVIYKDFRWKFDPKMLIIKRMINFSFYLFIESTAISLFQQFDKIIVGFVLGPALAGVYSIGTSAGLRMSILAGQITEVMIPYASQKDSLGENEHLFEIYRKLSFYVSLIIAVVGSLLILWMHEILTFWISPDFAEKYTIFFSIVIIAYGILSLSRPGDQTLQGIGQVKFASVIYLISSIAMLIGVYILAKALHLIGAAIANTIMILLLGMNLRIYSLYGKRVIWKDIIYDLVYGLILPLTVLFISFLKLTITFKISVTLLIMIWLVIIYYRDTFAKSQVSKLLKIILKPQ